MLLGLAGKAGSGKDTVCEYIQDWAREQGREATRDAFADRLKISAARALGFEGAPSECIEFCNDMKRAGTVTVNFDNEKLGRFHSVTQSWKGWELSGREYLQLYGTEAHRDVFDHDFWIRAVLPDPREKYQGRDPYDILVVTDVRFKNEAQWILGCGGRVWQILREGSGAGDHASEQPLPGNFISDRIYNHGSLDELRDTVMSMMDIQVYSAK